VEAIVNLKSLHEKQEHILATKKRFNILKCGRRFGKTELAEDIAINTALDGYPAGYWSPTYKDLYEVWNNVKRVLVDVTKRKDEQVKQIELITGGKIDFWSMEDPDSGRGRKYKVAIVDEAEKASKLESALNGTIIPTLADFQGDLWVISSPKFGRTYFKELYESAGENWAKWRFTTYDNPYIQKEEIDLQRRILPSQYFDCEFLAQDVDLVSMPFAYNFKKEHIKETTIMPTNGRFSQDFNVDPMANIYLQMWFDSQGHHIWFHDETELFNSGTQEMLTTLKTKYSPQTHATSFWTGDATSQKRTAEQTIKSTKHITSWVMIDRAFNLGKRMQVPRANPPVSSTRELLNTILALHPDIRFNPRMEKTINEMRYVEADENGSIKKGERKDDTKRADFLDCVRYALSTWCGDFIQNPKKYGVR